MFLDLFEYRKNETERDLLIDRSFSITKNAAVWNAFISDLKSSGVFSKILWAKPAVIITNTPKNLTTGTTSSNDSGSTLAISNQSSRFSFLLLSCLLALCFILF